MIHMGYQAPSNFQALLFLICATISLYLFQAIHSSSGTANVGASRVAQMPHPDYHRSVSSPASYGNFVQHTSNVHVPPASLGITTYPEQRSQYPPHYNSQVYYHPSTAAAQYVNNPAAGSNLWYNAPHQPQYYTMNGTQALGSQFQNYVHSKFLRHCRSYFC